MRASGHPQVSKAIQTFAVVFSDMQRKRHYSDYDPGTYHAKRQQILGLQDLGWKNGSRGDTGGIEIEAAEVKVDGVAESLAVAEPAR